MTENDLNQRISGLCVTEDIRQNKYSIDPGLFDTLVDQAQPNGHEPIVGSSRTLKQRLVEFDETQDSKFLSDLFNQRLEEGLGEFIFAVGSGSSPEEEEDGVPMNLKDDDVAAVTETVGNVAKSLVSGEGALATLLLDSGAPAKSQLEKTYSRDIAEGPTLKKKKQQPLPVNGGGNARTLHYLVRKKPTGAENVMETRIAVAGNVDAGKSTMLGVLTQGRLDDGRGKARVALFRHKHEIDSGRTSSVGQEILGFDKSSGAPIRHINVHKKTGWDGICGRSSKLVSFLDLAGHERYLKTTAFGMAGGAPDYVMLMVAANAGLTGMTKEHLGLALALTIPVFVVITKIDMCPPAILDTTIKHLTKVLRSSGCRKLPLAVRDQASVLMAASRFVNQRVCPIFQVSNVTGEGVECLETFLNIMPLVCHHSQAAANYAMQFDINETFMVPFVGTVVSGVVAAGTARPGDSVWLGPDYNGHFVPTVIKSIQRKRVDVQVAYQGQGVALALKKIERSQVRKGMVLLSCDTPAGHSHQEKEPDASRTFEAEVVVLYHSTTISSRYQAMVHCGAVRQTTRVLSIVQDGNESETLRTGDRARVIFQFIRHPEYLTAGSRLVFREGRTKGVGKVVRVLSRAEELEAVRKATGGSMVFNHRMDKARKG